MQTHLLYSHSPPQPKNPFNKNETPTKTKKKKKKPSKRREEDRERREGGSRKRWGKMRGPKILWAAVVVARGGVTGRARSTLARGDRAYRIRVDRLCVSTKRFNTRRVTDSSRRSLPLQPHGRVASTCAARLRLIYGRGATVFPKIPTSVAGHPPSRPLPLTPTLEFI